MFALRLYSSLWTDLYPHGKHTIAYKYQRNTAFVNHCILQIQNDILALICSCNICDSSEQYEANILNLKMHVCKFSQLSCCYNHSLKLGGKGGGGRINFFINNNQLDIVNVIEYWKCMKRPFFAAVVLGQFENIITASPDLLLMQTS